MALIQRRGTVRRGPRPCPNCRGTGRYRFTLQKRGETHPTTYEGPCRRCHQTGIGTPPKDPEYVRARLCIYLPVDLHNALAELQAQHRVDFKQATREFWQALVDRYREAM